MQLVVKILRNAYMPLPLSCNRPLQQLVGMLLRADPDDRPTTADLLATSLVRKHLQLLLGLAQGVQRGPALAAAGAALEAEQAGAAGGSRSGTPEAGKRGGSSSSSQAAGAAGGALDSRAAPVYLQQLEQQQLDEDVPAEEVQLGGGLSLALRDMMLAVKRMAKAPLHAGGSSSSSPARRRRVAAAAPGTASAAGDGRTGLGSDGSSDSNSHSGEQPGSSSPACGERQTGGSRGSTRARPGSEKQQTTAGGSSSDALEAEAAASRSASVSTGAAAYAALPTPVAVPATKRPSLHAWDASAAYEVQQKKRAEARYQARIMEQRMAREQVSRCTAGSSQQFGQTAPYLGCVGVRGSRRA
jgi:hypothetical protein